MVSLTVNKARIRARGRVALAQWVNPLFLSSPLAIVQDFIKLAGNGTLAHDAAVSGEEFVLGYLLAVGVGIPLGIAIGWYPKVSATLQPFVSGLYSTPKVALLPLMIIFLGIGLVSKVAIVFLQAVFQIIINTEAGVRSADESLLTAARSFGATDSQIFWTITLPSSVPFLLAGLRLAVGVGLIGVFVGELYGSTSGIGYLIVNAGSSFDTATVFVGTLIMTAFGIVATSLLRALENRFESWRPQRAR
jgi:ABC-type nitrate/sulfonate/bicarbonate transport system permease component